MIHKTVFQGDTFTLIINMHDCPRRLVMNYFIERVIDTSTKKITRIQQWIVKNTSAVNYS